MATISAKTFGRGALAYTYDDRWIDIAMFDRTNRRLWTVSVGESGAFYATREDRKSPAHEWEQASSPLPRKMAVAILAAAIRDGHIKPNRQS